MGVYRRLKRQDGSRPTTGPGAAPPAAREDLHAELKARSGTGISFEEQVEIIGQINETLQRNRIQIQPDTFHFTPRKKGSFIPILINAGAVAVTLAAAALIVLLFNAGERTLVSRSAEVLTAEGRLIQALKKETAEQLRTKDQEISQIQVRLASLAQERDKLRLDSQAQLARRETELKAALDKELAAERQKLERSGLASASIARQLTDLESRLASANQKQLADLRRQAESELAAKDASLAALAGQYTDSLKAFQQERTTLEDMARSREAELNARLREQAAAAETDRSRLLEQTTALASLRESSQREQLVFDQLLSAYLRVMEAWKNKLYDEALKNLEGVRELLSRESVAGLPAIQSRLPVERFVIDSLSRLIETDRSGSRPAASAPSAADNLLAGVAKTVAEADLKAQAGSTDEALKLYEQALRQVPEVRKSYTALNQTARKSAEQERLKLAEELAKTRQELARLQAGEKRREAQQAQLKALQDRIASAGSGTTADAQAQMLALLETKVRVRQVLAAEPVRSQNPGLYEQLEKFLEAYGQEQRQEGQVEALQDATAVVEGLSPRTPRLDARRLKGDYGGTAQGPFAGFVERLRGLLQ